MKKISALLVALVLLLSVLPCSSAFAAKRTYLKTVDDFLSNLNVMSTLMGTKHGFGWREADLTQGEKIDTFMMTYNNCEILMLTCPHNTDKVTSVLITYVENSSPLASMYVEDFASLIYEVSYAVGLDENGNSVSDTFKELGLFDNTDDGDANSITVNGFKLSYSVSDALGIMYGIEVA